jgi:UDP-glucose 4-epimerase
MNVLVTGVAGYVGSVCAEVLVRRGHKVIGLDNLAEGHRQAVPEQAVFWQCDLGDRKQLDGLFDSSPIDAVMHFAAESVVEKSLQEPSRFYIANVVGGVNLLDAMLRHGVKKLIFSSTAAVYGDPEKVPVPEEHRKSPINPYGGSKLVFEQILEDYRVHAGVSSVSLRYFNAAGASNERGEDHRNETHLIPRLMDVAIGKREQIQVHGDDYATPDGTCIRDYVHVLDIAEAHILALAQLERVAGQAFNVGNNRGYSVLEVLDVARRVTGRPIPAVAAPKRPGDPAALVASSEKIRRELEWEPRLSSLESIVESAWVWKQRFPWGYARENAKPRPSRAGSQSA